MEKEQHTDKCCYWDDEEFCDCGEREGKRLQVEIDRLTAENANLEAALRGKTMYHSDEHVNREMGMLRAENAKLREVLKSIAASWPSEGESACNFAAEISEAARQALKEAE